MIWEAMHPSEPFFLAEGERAPPAPAGAGLLSGFDVLGSAERQATFLWQVRRSATRLRCRRTTTREREHESVNTRYVS